MKDYSKYCIGCWNETKCQQKYYMLAGTEPVPGFVNNADIWCEDHAGKSAVSADYYIESDTPMHCAECGRPLQCSLTDYGVDYIKKVIRGRDGCCRELWPTLFGDYL